MMTDLEVKRMIVELITSTETLSKRQIINRIAKREGLDKDDVRVVYDLVKLGVL